MKIHRPIEQVGMPPVFGTACLPKRLSGPLRDHACKFGEGALPYTRSCSPTASTAVVLGVLVSTIALAANRVRR